MGHFASGPMTQQKTDNSSPVIDLKSTSVTASIKLPPLDITPSSGTEYLVRTRRASTITLYSETFMEPVAPGCLKICGSRGPSEKPFCVDTASDESHVRHSRGLGRQIQMTIAAHCTAVLLVLVRAGAVPDAAIIMVVVMKAFVVVANILSFAYFDR